MIQRRTPLGEMLTLYRAAHGLTVRDLAPRMGISYPTLNRIERGEQCDVPTFLKLVAWMHEAGSRRSSS
jgi:transcriptional regulator with XRE-family HTH domain